MRHLEELNELPTPVAVADQPQHLAGEQVDPGQELEAPPSIWSTFGMKGLDSASIELVIMRRKADRHADAGDLRRQQARREMRGERSPLTKA
jgi:hypothetical protein